MYILLAKGIALVEPTTYTLTMLAESPVANDAGGDYFDGRIYFASSSHLFRYGPVK